MHPKIAHHFKSRVNNELYIEEAHRLGLITKEVRDRRIAKIETRKANGVESRVRREGLARAYKQNKRLRPSVWW